MSTPRQRARILSATEQLISELGQERATAGRIRAVARVSQDTFSSAFASREELMLTLFGDLTLRLRQAVIAGHRSQDSWVDGIRAALLGLLGYLEARPALARFLIVHSLAGDSKMLACRARALEELARAVELNCPPPAGGSSLAPFGSNTVVGTVVSVLHGRLIEQPAPPLRALCGPLMGVIVLPFLGVNAAREELSRPLSTAEGAVVSPLPVALPSVALPSVRLTDREIKVLAAVAARPAINNRGIATMVGASDQGQISRLLKRLLEFGLIESEWRTSTRTNAWNLTAEGVEELTGSGWAPSHAKHSRR